MPKQKDPTYHVLQTCNFRHNPPRTKVLFRGNYDECEEYIQTHLREAFKDYASFDNALKVEINDITLSKSKVSCTIDDGFVYYSQEEIVLD